eukprot:2678231-Ditylum_brightwellii.AAC.1
MVMKDERHHRIQGLSSLNDSIFYAEESNKANSIIGIGNVSNWEAVIPGGGNMTASVFESL